MYNQDIKERFLSSEKPGRAGHREFIWTVFERLSEFEEALDKDIYQMSKEELCDSIEKFRYVEYGTVCVTISVLKKYGKWCMENKVFGEVFSWIFAIDPKDIDPSDEIAKVLFRDEAEFLSLLSSMRDMGGGFSEVAMALLAWCGITAKEAYDLKDECVDLDAGVIKDNHGNILVSYIAPDIKAALLQYRNTTEAPRSNGRSTYMVYRDSADTFIRRFYTKKSAAKGTPVSYNQLTKSISNLTKQAESLGLSKQFTQLNLSRSGYLHRMLELEREGLDLDSYAGRRAICDLIRGTNIYPILWQYRHYKKAFNF